MVTVTVTVRIRDTRAANHAALNFSRSLYGILLVARAHLLRTGFNLNQPLLTTTCWLPKGVCITSCAWQAPHVRLSSSGSEERTNVDDVERAPSRILKGGIVPLNSPGLLFLH